MKYKHEKELEKLQDQLKSQLTILESLQELKLENVELKKQVANLMNDNQAVKLKLQKYEKAPQNFASKN
jgi:Asp-tRNA(Asn)/Glu-tRNA(Gln) amidotransferase C subunit